MSDIFAAILAALLQEEANRVMGGREPEVVFKEAMDGAVKYTDRVIKEITTFHENLKALREDHNCKTMSVAAKQFIVLDEHFNQLARIMDACGAAHIALSHANGIMSHHHDEAPETVEKPDGLH